MALRSVSSASVLVLRGGSAQMSTLKRKFMSHAENLQKCIEHPGGFNNGADTGYISFLHNGEEYTVTVTSNIKMLTASLWKDSKCLETVMGKDGILFVSDFKL